MRRAIFLLILVLVSSTVLAHSEDPALEHDHPVAETESNEEAKYFGVRDQARDWMFTGYGVLVGAFIAWVITHIWYQKKK